MLPRSEPVAYRCRRKVALSLQDDPYRSIRRHIGAAMVLLLVLLVVGAVWVGFLFEM